MTMTLDEVRKTRFHMSRRNGYEVTDVDIFVDKVEATLIQLTEQNDHLRRQVDAAQAGGAMPENHDEVERLRGEVDRLGRAADELAALQQENQQLRHEVDRLGQEAAAVGGLQQENQRLRHELDEARANQGVDEGVLQENQHLRQLVDTHAGRAAEADGIAQENERLRAQLDELMNRPLADAERAALPIRVTSSSEASSAVVRLVQLATEQAEALVTEAQADADKRLAEARAAAERMTDEAQAHAARALAAWIAATARCRA